MHASLRILMVAGARPNFLKIAPLLKACGVVGGVEAVLVHTGQHYDDEMSGRFFRELSIPSPEINLGVGSGSHASQTAEIMKSFEPVLERIAPDAVLVVGDVNSTIACGLVAVKAGVELIHVEAGLRSFDRTMPEEINRVLTDAISDLLFCTEESAVSNLRQEGIASEKIHLAGNVMIDSLVGAAEGIAASDIVRRLDLDGKDYVVLTLHRPANVDSREVFAGLLDVLETIQRRAIVVFPAHPRTRRRLEEWNLAQRVAGMPNMLICEPLGYFDFVRLMKSARLVMTDSGGIQEETTYMGIPCLTLRENTERPVTVELGTNRVVGRDPARILSAWEEIMAGDFRHGTVPPLWDGHAAERIVRIIRDHR